MGFSTYTCLPAWAAQIVISECRPDRHQRMPVVRRGNRNGVQALIFQRLSHIRHSLAGKSVSSLLLHVSQSLCQDLLVRIDQVGEFHVRLTQPGINVTGALAVHARYSDAQPIVGAQGLRRSGAADDECRSGGQ